uniref:Uncharacterized protein n=1 Tax=Micrurus carvalhoi TaxID=3147026 RepID=A0A2H6N6F8_9SAUR
MDGWNGLLEHAGSDILLEVLDSLDCKYHIEHQIIPYSITWKRKVFSSTSGSDSCQEETAVEREVLLVMQPSYFLRQLSSSMQVLYSTLICEYKYEWQGFPSQLLNCPLLLRF